MPAFNPNEPQNSEIVDADLLRDQFNAVHDEAIAPETDPVFAASEAAKLLPGDKAKLDTALQDPTAFATAAQGAKADTALQSETDPVFTASEAAKLVTGDKVKIDTALQDPTAFAPAMPPLWPGLDGLSLPAGINRGYTVGYNVALYAAASVYPSTTPGTDAVVQSADANVHLAAAAGHRIIVSAEIMDETTGRLFLREDGDGSGLAGVLKPDATADGTYPIMNDGVTTGQLTGITIKNGLITGVTVVQ